MAVYKLVRGFAFQQADSLADVDGKEAGLSADAAMKLAELDIVRRLNEKGLLPFDDLDEKYPELYRSLVQVLYNAGIRIKRI